MVRALLETMYFILVLFVNVMTPRKFFGKGRTSKRLLGNMFVETENSRVV